MPEVPNTQASILSNKKAKIKRLLPWVVMFFLGFFLRSGETMISASTAPKPVRVYPIRESSYASSTAYQYIDPLIGCTTGEQKDTEELAPLKNLFAAEISKRVAAGDASTTSVYFDTRDGRWLNVNPDEKFFPASLMKVPTMIAVLNQADVHPEILNKKVLYDGSFDLNAMEYFKPAKTMVAGQWYTVSDLIERMIVYSDNNALPLIINILNRDSLQAVFTDLGIKIPNNEEVTLADYITVRQYSNFFRVLYNSSYLSRDMSEKALELLVRPDFPQGIEATIPKDIPVAQKFGERGDSLDPNDPASQKQLHDCGIVYYPKHPYVICIMTKGHDFNKLSSVIRDLSGLAFNYVKTKIATEN